MSQLHLLEQYIEHNEIFKVKNLVQEIFSEELVKKYGSAYLRIMWIRILNLLLHHYERRGRNAAEIEKMLQNYNLLDRIQSLQEIRQKIIEMVMECVSTESVADANARSKIQMAIGYIQEHFAENLTVNVLVEHYGMSPNYFSSMFKKEMSRSAVNYITELRINQARELLYHSELSVVDISKKVGYEDSQYFFRVFKKYLGMTPLQYREESRKNHRILRTRVVCIRTEKASSQVADALKLHANAQVTRLTRVRHLEHVNENAPVVYTTVYVPHQLFPEMSQLDFTDASLYEALDARGLAVAHASRRLEVTMPPAEIAVDLKISPFEPTVWITSLGYTKSGQVVEYSESYYPASHSSFQIEINR